MGMPRDFTIALAAGVPHEQGAIGRFIGIIEAPAGPLDVQIDGQTALRRGPGGSILTSVPFKRVTLTSTVLQTVRVLVADEVQDVSNITTSGASGGAAPTIEAPSDTVATPDDNAIAAATTENIAANLNRRRITIGVLSTATDPIRVQAVGANDSSGVEIVPGMSYRFDTTASLDVRCNGATGSTYWIFEEEGP